MRIFAGAGSAIAVLLVFAGAASGQAGVVQWSLAADPAAAPPGARVLVRAAAHIEPGWHLYSASSPAGIPATFQLAPNALAERLRVFQPPPKRAFDQNFGSDTE